MGEKGKGEDGEEKRRERKKKGKREKIGTKTHLTPPCSKKYEYLNLDCPPPLD